MRNCSKTLLVSVIFVLLMLNACGGMRTTVFIHPEFNFGFVEKVAVVPLENLSSEQGAGSRATRYLIATLLSTEAFEVVEPGEVSRVLSKYSTVRTGEMSSQDIKSMAAELGVQSIFFGSVNEVTAVRSGSSSTHTVTVVIRMVETELGDTVWSATHTESGKSFLASIFGGGAKSQSEVMRKCIKKALGTLVK